MQVGSLVPVLRKILLLQYELDVTFDQSGVKLVMGKTLICSANLIKKDDPSYNKETHSTSYYDFIAVTFLLLLIKNLSQKKMNNAVCGKSSVVCRNDFL